MTYHYRTSGTCSRAITVEIEGEIVKSVSYEGGCQGNLTGLGRLAAGQPIDTLITRLSGIPCGGKPTSCPDQLARALKLIRSKIAEKH